MVQGQEAGIAGVHVFEFDPHEDDRGYVAEVFRAGWVPDEPDMLQANLSFSKAAVLRGLHFHREQADYWIVLSGTPFIALYDLRKGSPTAGERAEIEFEEGARAGLYLPPGVAHGFYAHTDLALLYLVTSYFSGDDEFGLAWDDPDVGIRWPATDPILSERDRNNPSLAEVLRDPPVYSDW